MEEESVLGPIYSKLREKDKEERALLAACQSIVAETGAKQVLASYFGVLFQSLQTCLEQVSHFLI